MHFVNYICIVKICVSWPQLLSVTAEFFDSSLLIFNELLLDLQSAWSLCLLLRIFKVRTSSQHLVGCEINVSSRRESARRPASVSQSVNLSQPPHPVPPSLPQPLNDHQWHAICSHFEMAGIVIISSHMSITPAKKTQPNRRPRRLRRCGVN